MEIERYVFQCTVTDTETDEVIASGSVELNNEVRGDYEGLALDGPNEWTEDRAEQTFWDVMRSFRRMQAKIKESDDEVDIEEETI